MALPDLVEIVGPTHPKPVRVAIPGSKSITNRALVLAALGDGTARLTGALWSEDTAIMVDALRALGLEVTVEPDPHEPGNRTIAVAGLGGRLPNAGTIADPLPIAVGNAGTAARFLMAMLCLGRGVYRMSGTARMHERPQGALLAALGALGYTIESNGRSLPATIHGSGPRPGASCTVAIDQSSQFASALLLSARAGGWQVRITGDAAEESAYVSMTSTLAALFPRGGGDFQIEPDCSSASYFLAAGALLPETALAIDAWPGSGWQIDARFVEFLRRFEARSDAPYPDVSRLHDLGDSIMTAIVLAPLLPRPSRFVDLGRLRLQECERVRALRTELTACGAAVTEIGDTLEVHPSKLHGAEIETYDDHRMAMCFSTLGLVTPGMRIRNPACVKKTFPTFYATLAAPAPGGLGATVLDARTGRPLAGDDLLAG